jgi:putative ABC transport system permease protein
MSVYRGMTEPTTSPSRSVWLENLLQDTKYALRGLRRSPAFTITVILTLGLGIGANTAMFGIIDRLMFKPFPYLRDQDAVHRVYTASTYRDTRSWGGVSQYTTYLDLKKWSHTFSQSTGVATRSFAIGIGQAAKERPVGVVNASFWDFFDAKPALGRYFVAAEDSVPRGADVAVLSWEFWQSEFGGRNVIGEKLHIYNLTTEIIGVTPKGFVGIFDANPPVAYIPITTYAGSSPGMRDRNEYFTTYSWGWMDMMVRRKAGVTVEAANADLTQAEVKSYEAMLVSQKGGTPTDAAKPVAIAGPLKTAAGPDPSVEARTVGWVSGIALVVLLIACSNVANLFLARALKRRRETAVRIALGGGRGRLMAQWFTESLLLAVIGCAAGVLIAQWGGSALRQLFVGAGAAIPVASDFRTLAISGGLAIFAAVLTGVAPILVAGRSGVAGDLKARGGKGTPHRSRLRTGLLVLQVTLSVVLLVGAGLFVRSFSKVQALRLGYDFDKALLVSRNMRGATVADSDLVQLQSRMLEAVKAHPDVESAALASSVPFWSTSSTNLKVEGIDSVRKLGQFTYQTASADYFKAMGTQILRGRGFTDADRKGAPRIAVVSDAMAKVLWPGKEAIGQCMKVGGGGNVDTMPCTTVVGIAENAAQNQITDSDKRYRYYLPIEQYGEARGNFLITRVRGNPALVRESVRKAVQQVMPGDAYVTTQPFGELISGRQRSWRFGATMFVAFGFLALVVAAIGLYGVIGYDVAQRMHELGVRIALGAQSGDLIRLVMRQAVQVAVIGIVIGSGIALAVSTKMEPLLFKQSARDPVVISFVAGVLFLSAVTACLAPALRASRADPNTALRSD